MPVQSKNEATIHRNPRRLLNLPPQPIQISRRPFRLRVRPHLQPLQRAPCAWTLRKNPIKDTPPADNPHPASDAASSTSSATVISVSVNHLIFNFINLPAKFLAPFLVDERVVIRKLDKRMPPKILHGANIPHDIFHRPLAILPPQHHVQCAEIASPRTYSANVCTVKRLYGRSPSRSVPRHRKPPRRPPTPAQNRSSQTSVPALCAPPPPQRSASQHFRLRR